MSKRAILAFITVAFFFSSCNPTSPEIVPLIPASFQPGPLKMEIVVPPDTPDYPYDSPIEYLPMVFQFNITTDEEKADPPPGVGIQSPLYRLTYAIEVNPLPDPVVYPTVPPVEEPTGPILADSTHIPPISPLRPPEFCPRAIYWDYIDLYGHSSPGQLEVQFPITLPEGAVTIRVCGLLNYMGSDEPPPLSMNNLSGYGDQALDIVEFSLEPLEGSGRYVRYRTGFVRRHLVESGRGLSQVFLKRYDPNQDPKELLYFSRMFTVPGGDITHYTQIYVPWVAGPEGPFFEGEDHPKREGVIFGGDENPLLRSGLALAMFSLEYTSTGNEDSLALAEEIFTFIESCEVDFGAPRGFFLRSSWPGDDRSKNNPGYLHASIDEIAGMTLGLAYFHKALQEAPDDPRWTQVHDRVIALTGRLGRQMSDNYYFLIPPEYTDIPQERHRGWSGGYLFEWFLKKGFHYITGETFNPPGVPLTSVWSNITSIPYTHDSDLDDDEEVELLGHLLLTDLSAEERAVLTIKGFGIQMYLDGDPIEFVIEIDNIFRPPKHSDVYCFLNPLVPGCVPDPLNDRFPMYIQISADMPEYERYNYAMLLHVFQLAMLDQSMTDDVESEMTTLINAVLGHAGEDDTTNVPLKDLADAWLGIDIDLITFLNPVVPGTYIVTDVLTFNVGTRSADNDYYTAAIARAFDLSSNSDVSRAINTPLSLFATDLPVTQRDLADPEMHTVYPENSADGTIVLDHSPDGAMGNAFCWEGRPTECTQKPGGDGDLGVMDEMILALYDETVDVMQEGSGVDFILPTMLIYNDLDTATRAEVQQGIDAQSLMQDVLLVGCTSDPHIWELAPGTMEPGFVMPGLCNYPWPKNFPDDYEGNDRIEFAASLGNMNTPFLSIDHSTLYSDQGATRGAPFPATYHWMPSLSDDYSSNPYSAHIWNTDDIDYYEAEVCREGDSLQVTVSFLNSENVYRRLVVDGITADGDSVTVPPKRTHVIMVTGDASQYELILDCIESE